MNDNPKILVVEDEPDMAMGLRDNLQFEGYDVIMAHDGEAGLDLALKEKPVLVLLDVMMPKLDGFEVCRLLRENLFRSPILMLTARGQEIDKVRGLELGADDYITKPFDFSELQARCRAVLRRQGGDARNEKQVGDTVLDLLAGSLSRPGQTDALRNRELRLAEVFFSAPERIFSKPHLVDRLFSYDEEVSENAIEVYVGRLRKKLEGGNVQIETVRGLGYRLVVAQ